MRPARNIAVSGSFFFPFSSWSHADSEERIHHRAASPGYSRLMPDPDILAIEAALNDADTLIRQRLEPLSSDIAYVVLAMTPEGVGMIRSNVGAPVMRAMARMLLQVAAQSEQNEERPN